MDLVGKLLADVMAKIMQALNDLAMALQQRLMAEFLKLQQQAMDLLMNGQNMALNALKSQLMQMTLPPMPKPNFVITTPTLPNFNESIPTLPSPTNILEAAFADSAQIIANLQSSVSSSLSDSMEQMSGGNITDAVHDSTAADIQRLAIFLCP